MVVAATPVYNTKWQVNGSTVGLCTSLKVPDKYTLIDITSQGDAFTRRFPTIEDWSISADVVMDIVNDVAQAAIHTAWKAKTTIVCVINMDATGTHYYTGTGYVESFDKTFDPSGVTKASIVIQCNSALVYT